MEGQLESFDQHHQSGVAWLEQLGLAAPAGDAKPLPVDQAVGKLSERIETELRHAEARLADLKALRLPQWTGLAGFVAIYLLAGALVAPASLALLGTSNWQAYAVSLVGVGLGGTALGAWLRVRARRQAATGFGELADSVRKGIELCRQALRETAADAKRRKRKLRAQRDADFARADEERAVVGRLNDQRRGVELPEWTRAADQNLQLVDQQADERLRQLEHERDQRVRSEHERFGAAAASIEAADTRQSASIAARREQARAAQMLDWNQTVSASRSALVELTTELAAGSPAWSIAPQTVGAPRAVPRAIRFGWLRGQRLQGLAADRAARIADLVADEEVVLPAALDTAGGLSVLVQHDADGRPDAVSLLQTVMMRLLSSLPPGKARFTIIDPQGLGENFASFMHLADYDELLVNHRIWTEPAQIDRKLAEITEHMETVIQKYLRNEFATIHDYNAHAGEIAEPLRIVVVADFPTGFTEAAARRLAKIAANGPRCGVHLLLSTDLRSARKLPIDYAELQKHAEWFSIEKGNWRWHDAVFEQLEFSLDPPPAQSLKQLLRAVGEAAAQARRVEVPFEAIAPSDTDYWMSDSRRGVEVPLGRAGATRLQCLRLGEGTSQHVLIAGKTGSGKSTLLHALITDAALRYSPDELQLYLIDFKKGVEFKAYVTHQLPHARVVAVESEREFGLSVMQRLDAEMRRRGEMFRAQGVQDIGLFRDAGHQLPRVLFVVDEFQEFFVQDDKVAQEAALLLDRLVRQGRAFGIHVILGSQTLSGAYGLARSTLGQMAVRIALQCNEADAQVILSEDNTAARLLSRPGEAIYNDANGLVEGNHLFQVVWASDERREFYLERIRELAEAKGLSPAAPIVFEGAQPACLERNVAIAQLLTTDRPQTGDPRVWLGEPLAIEESTNVGFARRGGANLLWIGQNERAAAGMMTAAMFSLLARLPRDDSPTCVLLHDSAVPDEFASAVKQFGLAFANQIASYRATEAAAVIRQFAAELERRRAGGHAAPMFLFLYDVARLRALRRKDDDFGFGRASSESSARPDRQLAELLREGPTYGLHTLAWCDTLANLNRTWERATWREFDTRVLLQMSAADSSLLTDTAIAGQLGPHRAVLQREELGVLEKFRPFNAPSDTWLRGVCAQLTLQSCHATDRTPAGA